MKTQILKKIIIVVATLIVAVIVFFLWKQINTLGEELAARQGNTVISLELVFAPQRAAAMIQGWRQGQLISIARKSVHWDWLLISAYMGLLFLVRELIQAVKGDTFSGWASHLLRYLPFTIAGFDIVENLGIYALLSFDHLSGFLFTIATVLVGIVAALKFFLLFIFVVVAWREMRMNLKVFLLPRFSLLMLAMSVVLIFVPQWQEALLAVVESGSSGSYRAYFWLSFWWGLATFIASITTWYSARVMYRLRLVRTIDSRSMADRKTTTFKTFKATVLKILEPSDTDLAASATEKQTAPVMKKWYPRVLGAMVPIISIVGLLVAVDWDFTSQPGLPLIFLSSALALYLLLVLFRRSLFKLEETHEDEFGIYDSIFDRHMPWSSKGVLYFLVVLYLVVFISVWHDPLWFQGAGSAAVVIGAFALIVPIGNGVVFYAERWGLPFLLISLALAGLFSFHNDNHWVRLNDIAASTDSSQKAGSLPTEIGAYGNLKKYAIAWADARKGPAGSKADIPLFIVSTEGGGIRAAYWTAIVLANLQDKDKRFADYLFAISGVSGGSLGGTVFAAQVADSIPPKARSYLDHADAILQGDFLSPTVAALLYTDLWQRFLPWAVFNDRAIALEKSWERAWEDSWSGGDDDEKRESTLQQKRFKKPFDQLWRRTDKSLPDKWVPLLFLNSTVVETGNRLIMHPLTFDPHPADVGFQNSIASFSGVFSDAIDGRAALGGSVPVSTAIHLSARFTYVSPAGSVQNSLFAYHTANGQDIDIVNQNTRVRRWVRLVDGGYFENSATVTAQELLSALRRYQANVPACDPLYRIKPFIIHISNEPVRYPQKVINKQRGKEAAFGEVLSPLLALLHTRPARGFQARDELLGQMGENQAHFQLYDLGVTLPLGWALSAKARRNMQAQLNPDAAEALEGSSQKLRSDDPNEEAYIRWIEHAKKHNPKHTKKVLEQLKPISWQTTRGSTDHST